MTPRAPLDPRLLEALSAYLDGSLEGAQRAALEGRLAREADLRRELEELRAVRDSLRSLPELAPPRPLTLSPARAGIAARRPALFSPRVMAWGSALTSLAFVAVAGMDVFSRGFFLRGAATQAAEYAQPLALEAEAADAQMAAGGSEKAAATPSESMPGRNFAPPTETPPGAETHTPPAPAADSAAATEGEDNGCGQQLNGNQDAERCEWTGEFPTESEQPSFSLPDFPAAAPYLEGFFGISAVLLGAGAVILRRRR
jgi:hypothetical protein